MPEIHPDDEIVTIAQEISDYLIGHANAADSLEGVVKWWLTRQRYEQAADKVQQALEYLVKEGVVKKAHTTRGRSVYLSASRRLPRKTTG